MIAGFLLLRLTNNYGDPTPWTKQATPLFTLLSFLNCETFPPSLQHLLMTLGPLLLALAFLDRTGDWFNQSARKPGFIFRMVRIFGRVPLFFYLVHLALIHAIAVLLSLARYGRADWLIGLTPDPAAGEF